MAFKKRTELQQPETINGVYARGNSIRIMFYYNNIRCFETVATGNAKSDLNYAVRRRGEILRKIEDGEFDYRIEFPNSNNIKKFFNTYNFTCKDLLIKQIEKYNSMYLNGVIKLITKKTYQRIITGKLIPFFGEIVLPELTAYKIKEFIQSNKLTRKSLSQSIIPLKAMLDDALNDGMIKENPLEQLAIDKLIINNGTKSSYEVIPFNDQEKLEIINACNNPIIKALFIVGFYTGLRVGELIALKWSNIKADHLTVEQNIVKGELTTPKTKSGIRDVLLLPKARQALIELRSITGCSEYVFINRLKKPYTSSDAISKYWVSTLAKTSVKYRNLYQMRHSYASMLLSNGENIMWVASQLGHVDTEMVIKKYGRWIPQNSKLGYDLKGSY